MQLSILSFTESVRPLPAIKYSYPATNALTLHFEWVIHLYSIS
jgi:hypothetical protein